MMSALSENTKPILLRKSILSSVVNDSEYHIYWEGLVFIRGILSGEESVKVFIKELRSKNVEDASSLLKGIFFIVIQKKSTGDIYAFVDNSGLYQAFYTDNIISNSFLELIRYEKNTVADFDFEAIVEFLYFGNLFFNKTFFKSIKRIPRDKILCFSKGAEKILVSDKKNVDIHEPSENGIRSFYEIFEGTSLSLSNQNISIDITGGTDTRLIALMLDYFGLKFETAVSGGTDSYEDILISKKVSYAIRHSWYSTLHSISSLEEDINNLFYATEGLYDILRYHRLYQLQQARVARGIDTIISGVGGEFFKDFWWLQDFPFYSKRSANIERLVDMRIMPYKNVGPIVSEKLASRSENLRARIIRDLSQYELETNTMTYDNIFLNFRMREIAGRELTNYRHDVKTYAPFLDLDIVRIGFNLPRRMRFFNAFHRKELTRLNPSIANIGTTEGGISASSELRMMIRDVPQYFGEKLERLLIKLNLRKSNRFTFLNHPDFYCRAKELSISRESIDILKKLDIIKKQVDLAQLEDRYLGIFITIGMLVKYMRDNN